VAGRGRIYFFGAVVAVGHHSLADDKGSDGSVSLREERFKSWDCIVSDELVYGFETINSNLEITVHSGLLDWFAKYNSGDLYLELNLVFLGKRNCYARCVAIGVGGATRATDAIDAQPEINRTNSDNLMLVDIAKLVDLPEGVRLKRWPSRIWLKGLDDLQSFRGYAGDLFIETLTHRTGTLGFNREGGQPTGFISSEQSKLPSKLIQAGANTISEFPNEGADGIRDKCLCSAQDVPSLFNIIVSVFGIGFAFSKARDFLPELVEVFVRPTKLHLCIGKSNAQRHDHAPMAGS
jgi:hypothetical protein